LAGAVRLSRFVPAIHSGHPLAAGIHGPELHRIGEPGGEDIPSKEDDGTPASARKKMQIPATSGGKTGESPRGPRQMPYVDSSLGLEYEAVGTARTGRIIASVRTAELNVAAASVAE
jgi:hypothetical protein